MNLVSPKVTPNETSSSSAGSSPASTISVLKVVETSAIGAITSGFLLRLTA